MVRIPISCECRLRHSGLRVYNGLLYKLMFSSCTTWFLRVSYHTFQSLLLVLAFPLFIPGLRQRQKHWYNWEPREQRWHCITMEGGKGTRNGKFGGPASLFDRLFFCFIWRHFPRSAIRWFQWCRLDVYIYVVYLFTYIYSVCFYIYTSIYTPNTFLCPKLFSFWQALPQRTPVLHSLFPANFRPGFPYTDGFLDFVPLKVLQDFRILLATRQDMFLPKALAFGWIVDVHEVPAVMKQLQNVLLTPWQ